MNKVEHINFREFLRKYGKGKRSLTHSDFYPSRFSGSYSGLGLSPKVTCKLLPLEAINRF